jgi:hypothetical protein
VKNLHQEKSPASKAVVLKSIVSHLFEEICDAFDDLVDATGSPNLYFRGGVDLIREIEYASEMKGFYQALRKLERKKKLEIRTYANEVLVRLSNDDVLCGLLEKIRSSELLPAGRSYLVSFDIPEQERGLRQELRRFLKACGLKRRHDSLWICGQASGRELVLAFQVIGADKWVHLYDATILSGAI